MAVPDQDMCGKSTPSVKTRADLLRYLREEFRAASIDTADLDARVLACEAAKVSLEKFISDPQESVDNQQLLRAIEFRKRRLAGEPVARILNVREFWSQDFSLNAATLVPRPETEFLVEAAVCWIKSEQLKSPRVADLGTGSGCILVSILGEIPAATGIGVDISGEAIEAALSNAATARVADRAAFRLGSWVEALDGTFDLIVSNPPYIPTEDIDALEIGVAQYDPRIALDGGPDGLDAYRVIGAGAGDKLSTGGGLIVEIGMGQAQAVVTIMELNGFEPLDQYKIYLDLAGVERILVFQKREINRGIYVAN